MQDLIKIMARAQNTNNFSIGLIYSLSLCNVFLFIVFLLNIGLSHQHNINLFDKTYHLNDKKNVKNDSNT